MENIIQTVPGTEEKKYIRGRYMKAGLAILADYTIFNIFSRLTLLIIGALSGASGGIYEMMKAGQDIITGNDYLSVMFSIGFPIVAELTAIAMGIKMLDIDIKGKISRDGYNVGEIAGGTALGFFAQTVAVVVLMLLYLLIKGSTEDTADNVIVQKNSLGANIILYFYVCILGPIIEEVLFRGIVLESVRVYNERFAIVFSALIFGLMHGNATQAINGFLAGLVLGALYVRSGSIVPSSIMHILMNSVTSVLSVLIFSNPNIVEDLLSDPVSVMSGAPFAGIMINLLIRVISFPAGIVILVVAGQNGFGIRRANEAGRKRAAPLVLTSVSWIAVIILYTVTIVINF